MLQVQNVSKIFGKKDATFQALQDITFSVPASSSVAIIGKSGSGKSTLMHIMSGLDHPSEGTVSFMGKNITQMSQKSADTFRAKDMSFIFQAFFIEANRTCFDNVLLPMEIARVPRSKRSKNAMRALEAVGLEDKVNVKAKNLSGGQKQRLAVARAIVNQPKLLFADEPTGNLDSATGDKIMSLLFELQKKMGSTLVIVTHDMELAQKCDMQIHIADGRISEITTQKSRNVSVKKVGK